MITRSFVALTLVGAMVGCVGELGGESSEAGGAAPGDGGAGGAGGVTSSVGVGGTTGSGMTDPPPPPPPEQLAPCETGSCWDTALYPSACGYAAEDEDFSSGNYNVHRYASRLWAETETTITVTNDAGIWAPAIIVANLDGEVIYDGELGLVSAPLTATLVEDGQDGSVAQVRITSTTETEVDVFVTSWQTRDSGFVDPITTDAVYRLDIDSNCDPGAPGDAIAPDGALAGESDGNVGDNAIMMGAADWGAPLRFDVPAGTHVGFALDFSPSSADVDMQVLQWRGGAVREMALTNGGSGERVLAVLDSDANRTYWVRARGPVSDVSLSATFTPFAEGVTCQDDCDRLLQLPLPNDAATDGYDMAEVVVYRYQFGRRDVLMSLRHAGRVVADSGGEPFWVQDLSKGDGTRPPGHASHTDGKDVDLSVYDSGGNAVWYPLCDEVSNECIPGTDFGMDYAWMTRKIAPMLESNRVVYIFLDREFHTGLFSAADSLATAGDINAALIPYMEDAVRHWPNHNNHIHVRFETTDY